MRIYNFQIRKIFVFIFFFIFSNSLIAGYWDLDGALTYARQNGKLLLKQENGFTKEYSLNHIETINTIKNNISRQSGIYPKFLISSSYDVNAFASKSGGQPIVIFTLGMLDKLGNDYDAVAAIIGHEYAHLMLDHHDDKRTANTIIDILAGVALIAIDASWGGPAYNPYRDIHKIGLDVGSGLAKSAYSRSDEYEADRVGLEYAIKAGYSSSGALRVQTNIIPMSSNWFSTHPSSEDRIANLRTTISRLSFLEKRNIQHNNFDTKDANNNSYQTNKIETRDVVLNKKKEIIANNKVDNLAIFKSDCSYLGFSEGTTQFGECVLKLHKKNKKNIPKKTYVHNKNIPGSHCQRGDDYYPQDKIECDDLLNKTDDVDEPGTKKNIKNQDKHIGVLLSVKEKSKYIIFSSTQNTNLKEGDKVYIDEELQIEAEISNKFEGYYSADIESDKEIKKGQKIFLAI